MSWFRNLIDSEPDADPEDRTVSKAASEYHQSTMEMGDAADRLSAQAQQTLDSLVMFMEQKVL